MHATIGVRRSKRWDNLVVKLARKGGIIMQAEARPIQNSHLRILVTEGKVTMEDLHAALDQAIRHLVRGGCNCGMTGFDVSFVRGDPALTELTKIPNIQGAMLARG
jgi:hypothetical protein